MENYKYILEVQDLHTTFKTDNGDVHAVNGINFNLEPGKTLGIVGESGSGKSVSAYSIMQILADNGRITGGKVLFKGEDIVAWDKKKMAEFRGKCCSIIFQDPMTSLNPVFTVGYQLEEAVLLHTNRTKKEAKARAIEMLTLVGVNEPQKRIKQYPHELSGGMRQRVMIAMALACEPDILIADNLGTYYVGFNYNSDLYSKLGLDEEQAKVFRHALTLLIDRQYIIDNIGQTSQKIATTFIPEGCADGNGGEFKNKDYYSTDYEANVAEAKSLLESIGLYDTASDALTQTVAFTYLTNNSEGNVRIAEAIQADLATIGIDMSIEQQEWATFLNTRKNGDFDIAREGWIMDYNDPINMLEMWTTSSGNNDCQFGKDDSKALDWGYYDNLISEIRTEADLAKRAELMHTAEDYLMDTWCVVPIYYYNDPYMVKDYVKGVYCTVEGMKYFYHATIQ